MLYRGVKASLVSESAYQVAGRVVAGGPVTCTAAATSVQAVAVADRIATRAKAFARIGGDPETDLNLFDEFAGFTYFILYYIYYPYLFGLFIIFLISV